VEHALSAPIWQHLGGSGNFTASIYRRRADERTTTLRAEFETTVPSFARRTYCEICNTGWMIDMDYATEPIIAPMVRGEHGSLSFEDQKQLAAWVTKVALVCESLQGASKRVPDDAYLRFFFERRPRATEPIHLLHYIGGTIHHEFARRELVERDTQEVPIVHAVLMTLIVGEFVAQMPLSVSGRLAFTSHEGTDRIAIWPARLQAINWPPSLALNDRDLRVVTTEDPLPNEP
jgi:hypothetical protein